MPCCAAESPNPKQPVPQPSPWIELKFCMITFYVERIMCRVKTVTLRHCSMPSSPDLGDQGNPHQTKNLCFKSFGVRNLQKRLNQKFLGIWWWYNLCPNIWSTTRTQFKCILASQIEPSRIRSLQTNVLKKPICILSQQMFQAQSISVSQRQGRRQDVQEYAMHLHNGLSEC